MLKSLPLQAFAAFGVVWFSLQNPLYGQSLSGWDYTLLETGDILSQLHLGSTASGALDASGAWRLPIKNHWRFSGSVMITNRDRGWLGATHARPDLPVPFSTGRIISGEVDYSKDCFQIRLGRLFPNYHPWRQESPFARETISGDGVDWQYFHGTLTFHSRIEFLRNERDDLGQPNNRIFNFHRLGVKLGKYEWGGGEFLIYTGHDRALDWVWSNPFVPYMVHNYEYYSNERVTICGGDTDNTIIYTDLLYDDEKFSFSSRFYLDEFQVDGKDREIYTDEYLWHNQFLLPLINTSSLNPDELALTLAVASAGFGYHQGLFTSFYVGDYSLLPSESGRIRFLKLTSVWLWENGHLITDLWTGRYADLAGLNPTELHLRTKINDVDVSTEYGLQIRMAGKVFEKSVLQLDSNLGTLNKSQTLTWVQYLSL
jgi:hypothetical protein